MDPFSKKLLEELEQMQQTGRILRSMSLTRMMPLESGAGSRPWTSTRPRTGSSSMPTWPG